MMLLDACQVHSNVKTAEAWHHVSNVMPDCSVASEVSGLRAVDVQQLTAELRGSVHRMSTGAQTAVHMYTLC